MTTQPRERDGQRARERPVVAERHRRTERASRAPHRPTCRRDRERGRSDLPGGTPARLRGGVAPEWVERPTSAKLDPGVTSSEAARIRDRVREPGAPPSERDPHVEPRLSSRPRRPPATSLARPRGTPGARSRAHLPHAQVTPHTDDEAASRHPSARERGRSPDPHPGRPPVGELVHPGFPGDYVPWIPGSLVVWSCAA